MSSSVATTKWLKYFAQAGIPSKAAANYAVIFTENRIQPDMLLDLNKEYLYDMGIRVMGDVIAILRYARTAYTEEAQKKILGEELRKPVDTEPQVIQTHANTGGEALKGLVNHYYKPAEPARPRTRIDNSNISLMDIKAKSPKVKKISLKRSISDVDSDHYAEATPVSHKVKRVIPKPVPEESVSKNSLGTKRSVFKRLGESSVSSSTDSVMTVQSSIFERLGPSKIKAIPQAATSTVNESSVILSSASKHLAYKGVLKTITVKKPIKAVSLTTGAALRGRTAEPSIQLKKTIKNRLGLKPMSSSTVSTTSKTVFNPQRMILQRSLADVEAQRKHSVIKLSQVSKTTGVKSRLSTTGTSSLSVQRKVPVVRTLANTGLFSKSRTSTSERIVKKPTKILTKSSIFSRLGPL